MRTDLEKAADMLKSGEYTCVLCNNDKIITCTERGVKPLIDLLDSSAGLNGFSAADKVVGKAAAFLYVLLKVKEVYAPIISKSAICIFEENKIHFICDTSVDNIINRTKTGLCPMEEVVGNISDPLKALYSIRQRLSELRLRSV